MDNRCSKGFTLIEVLIAMTLLGILVVLLFSVMRIAGESWNAGESRTVEVNKKAVVYQFFKRHLATIRPVLLASGDPNDGEEPQQAFQGYPQRISFVAALPASSARKGWQIFEISQDPNMLSRLMVTLSPYQPTVNFQVDKAVLLDNVKRFSFAYFGATDNTSGNGLWQEQWVGMSHLPQLIKVSIQLEDGSYWPDMLFPVRINGNVQNSGSSN